MNNHTNRHSHLRLVTSTFIIAAASNTTAQDLGHKAPPQSSPIAITNASIHPMSGPSIGSAAGSSSSTRAPASTGTARSS